MESQTKSQSRRTVKLEGIVGGLRFTLKKTGILWVKVYSNRKSSIENNSLVEWEALLKFTKSRQDAPTLALFLLS